MTKIQTKRVPRSLDLFCGIGGLTLGFQRAGIQSIGGIDCCQNATQTFEHNLSPLRCFLSDITQTTVSEIEEFFQISASEIDIITGGPPCQGFSTVGKREITDPRNSLWRNFSNLVAEIRPAYVIIENVEGMLVMQGGKVRDSVIASFADIGYHMKCRLLKAADCGVPQLRKRAFFIGWLVGLLPPEFPVPSSNYYVTVADAISDLPPLNAGEICKSYHSAPQTAYQIARRKNANILLHHEAANHSQKLVEMLKYIPNGGNRKSIPDRLQPASGFHNSYARLASNKPAIAVTSNMRKPSSARATHPTQHRGLTVREGLRLQSFDDDFEVIGSRTSQYIQVGNAVPPLLGLAVGKEVVKAYQSHSDEEIVKARSQPIKSLNADLKFPIQLALEISV
ncbi:MAG: DNA cytosine methyltransferase [Oscillatoriaceae cyanobacterium Prado104]|jgi:DNA (cytosine-5)-methyltransferase 1|nr:DNA cytosine methyltransferase [Oscillatoriaceae cyanobacterium Prado104]